MNNFRSKILTKILPFLTARYTILCTRRLQPPRDECSVRVQYSLACYSWPSYTMVCPPVRGLSYEHVDKHGITILYHLNQFRPCTCEIFHAKVRKGGVMKCNLRNGPITCAKK